MPKPSEIFDTPAATGFSRVGGNEEILEEAFAEYEYQNDLLTVSSAKKILRAILTTKDQEKEEEIRAEKERVLSIVTWAIEDNVNFYLENEKNEVEFLGNDIRFSIAEKLADKNISNEALPTEDNN